MTGSTFLVYFKVFSSIKGAAAFWLAQAGNFLFRTRSLSHIHLIHKIFDSSLKGLIWLHDEWQECVFQKGLLHVWDWIL